MKSNRWIFSAVFFWVKKLKAIFHFKELYVLLIKKEGQYVFLHESKGFDSQS